jgi:hypothetical protein
MSTATATDEKNKKEPKLPKKPKPALVHHQPCRPRLYRLRPLCLSVVAINRAPNRNLSSLLRKTSSPEMHLHPTTPPPVTDHQARYIGRFRRVVLTLGRSLPRPLTRFLIPGRSIRRSPSISLSRRHEGAASAADHYLIIILPAPAPGGYTDRDRANGSCSPCFDQPFFTLKLVVLRGIAGCPRCPSVHPWKMEDMGK